MNAQRDEQAHGLGIYLTLLVKADDVRRYWRAPQFEEPRPSDIYIYLQKYAPPDAARLYAVVPGLRYTGW